MELIDEQSTYPSLLGGIDMGTGLLITVCVGLAASLTLLALSVWAGMDRPEREWARIVGLVLLGLSVAMRVALMVAIGQEGDLTGVAPVAIGTGAITIAGVSAVWRPVWAGWFLMGSAVVIPALLGLVQFVIRENQNEAIPAVALIATYSVPMVVMSALLILSGSTLRRATATTAAHTHAAPSRRASLHEHGT